MKHLIRYAAQFFKNYFLIRCRGYVACAYCGNAKPELDMTDEHVLPRALGGNLINNPFLLKNVCKTCNPACGRHVDGPFIKSWLIRNLRAANARKFADLGQSPVLPLEYMGELDQTWVNDKVCDLWLGPTGDTVFHFHDPYPQRKIGEPYTGPPLFLAASQIDPGFAFLYVVASNPMWHRCIFVSFVENFRDSVLYLGNGRTPGGGRFSDIPPTLHQLHNQLTLAIGQGLSVKFKVGIDFGHRFLGKLALGMGSLFLNSIFQKSKEARNLRDFMWEKDPTARANTQIAGTTFLSQKLQPIAKLLDWPAGHVFLLWPVEGQLFFLTIFYGEQPASIVVSANSAHWQGKIPDDGMLFLVAPGLRECVGPITLTDYLEVKMNNAAEPVSLVQLLAKLDSIPALPPYH